MMACRVGPVDIYRPLLWLLVPLTLGVAWLALDLGPRALQEVDRVSSEARREADLGSMEPGRFTEVGANDAVVYGERVLPDGSMQNVFLQRRVGDGRLEVVVAQSGEQVESDDPDVRFLVLRDGRRYEGVPGTSQFRVVEFAEHGIPYRLPSLDAPEPTPRAMSFSALMRAGQIEHIAEMQWRIGIPLATIILGILAVPLSKTQPRAGRYGRLAIGLLVFIIYLNMLSAAKAWIEQGSVSPTVGLWWVHCAVLLLALVLLGVQNSVHKRLRQ
jgi:lipopolysaccharide export system permease protein